MSILKRVFTWGKSEAHSALDHLEDPIKMAEQGIRELQKDLNESLQGLAKVKAQVIRTKRDVNQQKEIAVEYEQKAMMLLSKGQDGSLDPAEADRLAGEAIAKREAAVERVSVLSKEADNFDKMTGTLENNVQNLKHQLSKWQGELQTLKARAQVGQATRKLNEQLAKVDSSGTVAMLERMRDKVQEEESLAEAYGEMAQVERSVDDEIDKALAGSGPRDQNLALADLKARMGLGDPLALTDGALPDASKVVIEHK
jgi:phage shock protein A